jgi:hypothetical protein
MKISNSDKTEFWQRHVSAAPHYPAGITAYLRDNGLRSSSFYNWQHRLKNSNQIITKNPSKTKKKSLPSFLPLVVKKDPATAAAVEFQTSQSLPDSRWVAEVMLHLIRGLS